MSSKLQYQASVCCCKLTLHHHLMKQRRKHSLIVRTPVVHEILRLLYSLRVHANKHVIVMHEKLQASTVTGWMFDLTYERGHCHSL